MDARHIQKSYTGTLHAQRTHSDHTRRRSTQQHRHHLCATKAYKHNVHIQANTSQSIEREHANTRTQQTQTTGSTRPCNTHLANSMRRRGDTIKNKRNNRQHANTHTQAHAKALWNAHTHRDNMHTKQNTQWQEGETPSSPHRQQTSGMSVWPWTIHQCTQVSATRRHPPRCPQGGCRRWRCCRPRRRQRCHCAGAAPTATAPSSRRTLPRRPPRLGRCPKPGRGPAVPAP